MTCVRLSLARAGGGKAESAWGLRAVLVAVGARACGPPGALWDPLASRERHRAISPQRVRDRALTPGSIGLVPRDRPGGPAAAAEVGVGAPRSSYFRDLP